MYTLEDGSQIKIIPANYTGSVINKVGRIGWYQDGKWHPVDGPAREYDDGTKAWWFNDKLNRIDGPAWIKAEGNKEWWINSNQITKQTRILCTH
jgi:hypothetical protein